MKVSFYTQELLKNNKTGIEWTASSILNCISRDDNDIYSFDYFTIGYCDKQINELRKYQDKGFILNPCSRMSDIIYRWIWNLIPIPYSLFFGKDSDITQFFNYYIPPGVKGKKVTIIYDMTYKAYPKTVRLKTKLFLKLNVKKACKRADKIITISEFSKNEIIKYLKLNPDKIAIVPCGVDLDKYHSNGSKSEIENVKQKYGIKGEYFLYLGTLEPRKNIERLVRAYILLKKENKSAPKLVLAGKKGWLYKDIFKIVKNEGASESIIFTDYVAATDAPLLITGAKVFVFPSIYEGFGIPPLEAMACGTPVITSNTASLPEIVADAAIMVNPYSIIDIKEAMCRLLDDDVLVEDLRKKGFDRVKQFTWDNSAKKLVDVYKTLV